MKKTLQLYFSLVFFALGFSQELKPVAQKITDAKNTGKKTIKYDLFMVDQSIQRQNLYKNAAEDVTVMKLNTRQTKRIVSEQPEFIEMSFSFEGKIIEVELVKNNFLTHDFKLNTDKGYVGYTPGVYYQGIVKGDNESLVAMSFFDNDVVGITSIKDVGNIVLGKARNSENFVSYNDVKLKGENPFVCGTDELVENHGKATSYNPEVMTAKKTTNCVRIYYEVGYGPYTQNGSNVAMTANWATAMHNNVSTLYENDGITAALSEVFVWTAVDPFTGNPSEILTKFRNTRTNFNGDVAQLLRNPATTSIAYVDSLCTTSNHSYCGVSTSYSNVPTYSWNIEVMTHEIGHNLGSPHTHDCFWNGNNTRIDGCGPASGNAGNGTCPSAPLPTQTKGTIMSYCHLIGSVGINFANGFGEQPSALIRNKINSRACLGTDCIASCEPTITKLVLSNITSNSVTATITDNISTQWKYRLAKTDGTVISTGITNSKVLTFNDLQEATYYTVAVSRECTGSDSWSFEQLLLTDSNWCSGIKFTDPGGENANYYNGQTIVKTFYPTNSGDQLKMTFTQFDTEPGLDYLIIYDGPTTGFPRFPGPALISGNTIPGPFESTHETGAITVRFISNSTNTAPGWVATFECKALATGGNSVGKGTVVYASGGKGIFTITAPQQILSYEVYDASGKLIKKSGKLSGMQQKVDISNAPSGTYMVQIVTEKEAVIKKIIKP